MSHQTGICIPNHLKISFYSGFLITSLILPSLAGLWVLSITTPDFTALCPNTLTISATLCTKAINRRKRKTWDHLHTCSKLVARPEALGQLWTKKWRSGKGAGEGNMGAGGNRWWGWVLSTCGATFPPLIWWHIVTLVGQLIDLSGMDLGETTLCIWGCEYFKCDLIHLLQVIQALDVFRSLWTWSLMQLVNSFLRTMKQAWLMSWMQRRLMQACPQVISV